MADRYYVETYIPGTPADGFHEEFEGFEAAFQAATAKASLQPDRTVRIRMPASANADERSRVKDAGWDLA